MVTINNANAPYGCTSVQGVKGALPPTWAVSGGAEDNNSEVKLYHTGV